VKTARFAWALGFSLLVFLAASCDEQLPVADVPAPQGLDCSAVVIARDSAQLVQALAGAASGDCVLLETNTYAGSFQVPVGVTLAAQTGAEPLLTLPEDADEHLVLSLLGEGALVDGIVIEGRSALEDDGIVLDSGASARNATVRHTSVAVTVSCSSGDCSNATLTELLNLDLEENTSGLAIRGGPVAMRNVQIDDSGYGDGYPGTALSVSGGATVEAEDVTISNNNGIAAVVVDGTGGTSVQFSRLTLTQNDSHGVRAQFLEGTPETPALTLIDSLLEGSQGVALGALDSRGIVIRNTTLRDTRLAMTISGSTGVEVGEGIVLAGQTGAVTLEDVTLSNNGRCQMLIDDAGTAFMSGARRRRPGQYRVVAEYHGGGDIPLNTSVEMGAASSAAPDVLFAAL
jgi:hypothetical protein